MNNNANRFTLFFINETINNNIMMNPPVKKDVARARSGITVRNILLKDIPATYNVYNIEYILLSAKYFTLK